MGPIGDLWGGSRALHPLYPVRTCVSLRGILTYMALQGLLLVQCTFFEPASAALLASRHCSHTVEALPLQLGPCQPVLRFLGCHLLTWSALAEDHCSLCKPRCFLQILGHI